jgi:hypothetical protein
MNKSEVGSLCDRVKGEQHHWHPATQVLKLPKMTIQIQSTIFEFKLLQ